MGLDDVLDAIQLAESAYGDWLAEQVRAGAREQELRVHLAMRERILELRAQLDRLLDDGGAAPDSPPVGGGTPPPKTYPHFHREGNLLVKTGWQRKAQREYCHRVPWSSVKPVVDALARATGPLPVKELHKAIPAGPLGPVSVNHAYVALEWLRAEQLAERCGHAGYRFVADVSGGDPARRAEEAWNRLASRSWSRGRPTVETGGN